MAGKKVTVDFTAPELSSLGGLTLVREYEKSSSRIIERIESCIKDPRWEPMVIHSQTEMLRQRIYQIMAGFEGQRSSFIYSDCYCDRGRMEQMISELKNGLNADRMSCNKFSANQFRLYLHCAAYVILHSFQADMLVGTELESSTISSATCNLTAAGHVYSGATEWTCPLIPSLNTAESPDLFL